MKVLSLEQMNQLKELGIDVKPKGACLMYTSDSSDDYYLKYGESTCEDDVAAFSLQDIIYTSSRETGKPRSENTIRRMEIFVSDP